jgi:LysR family transcriptional regulator, carnitine catabolism transcriptional activator
VSLGTTPLVAANILPGAMREYRRRRPELRVRLFDADQDAVLRQVQAGGLDIGVGLFKSVPGVRRVPLFRFSMALIRARRRSAAAGADVPWSALDGRTVISLSPSSPHQQEIDRQLGRSRVRVEIGCVANLLETQVALVEADEGTQAFRASSAEGEAGTADRSGRTGSWPVTATEGQLERHSDRRSRYPRTYLRNGPGA